MQSNADPIDAIGASLLAYLEAIEGATPQGASTPRPCPAIDKLADAIGGYIDSAAAPCPCPPTPDPAAGAQPSPPTPEFPPLPEAEVAFTPAAHAPDGKKPRCAAVMLSIAETFSRVQRYTAQKARFIMVGREGASDKKAQLTTSVDLYRLSADEEDLYRLFLHEAADRLWAASFMPYVKKLPFRGYLFDEGKDIPTRTAQEAAASAWSSGDLVQVGKTLYVAIADVPVGGDILDQSLWREASPLYATKGKVAYFFQVDSQNTVPPNDREALAHAAAEYLYAFVLCRWYAMANVEAEAAAWSAACEAAAAEVRQELRARLNPVRRKIRPF
jgi:hypothetical protein